MVALSLMFIRKAPASLRCRLYTSRGGGVNLHGIGCRVNGAGYVAQLMDESIPLSPAYNTPMTHERATKSAL